MIRTQEIKERRCHVCILEHNDQSVKPTIIVNSLVFLCAEHYAAYMRRKEAEAQ